MAKFDLAKYDTVESRLEKYWEAHENGRVITKLLSDPNQLDEVVVQAEIYADRGDDRPVATGLAFEKRGTSFSDGANLTSHLENCETSAIGRAFANWLYKAKKDSPRPSREEMDKVNRFSTNGTNAGLPSAPAGEEWKEQIAAYKRECLQLLTNANQAEHMATFGAIKSLCSDIEPGLLDVNPNVGQWIPDNWKQFRDAVIKHVQKIPAIA